MGEETEQDYNISRLSFRWPTSRDAEGRDLSDLKPVSWKNQKEWEWHKETRDGLMSLQDSEETGRVSNFW